MVAERYNGGSGSGGDGEFVTLRDLPLVAPGRYVADDIENRAARPSPYAITWSETRARACRLLAGRRVGITNEDLSLLPPLPLAQHRIPLGGETARFSLRIPIRLPFALARPTVRGSFVSLSPSLFHRRPAGARTSFSRSSPKEEEGICTPIQHTHIYIYIYNYT